jgi:RNA polymerase sigma-70 factor (ECF subfamily)
MTRAAVRTAEQGAVAPVDLEAELARCHAAAHAWALACCRWDRDGAADVLQASYLKVVDGRARFEGRASFSTWLFGVIRLTAAEHRRREWMRRVLPLTWLDDRPEGRAADDVPAALIRSEQAQQLVCALERLPRRQREVLHLVFYQNVSIAEAAVVMGVSVGSARTHYERGKQRLRMLLGSER